MKKTTAITAAILAGASFAQAQEMSVTTTFAWESEYVFRGVALAEDTFMPSVDFAVGGAYFGIWAALPVDTVYGNEVDFYGGYGFDISETFGMDVGFVYYTYPDAQDDFFDDPNSLEFYVGFNFAVPASPSLYISYDVDLEALTLEGAVGHSFEMGDASAIDVSGYYGYVEPDEGSGYYYYGIGASYGYSFNDNVSLTVFTNLYGAENDTLGFERVNMMDEEGNVIGTMMATTDDMELSYGFAISAGF